MSGLNVVGVALVAAGVLMGIALRGAWRSKAGVRHLLFLSAGWCVFVAALYGATLDLGVARGLFIALTLVPLGGLAFVATGLQVRTPRARAASTETDIALEPSDRASRAWRGVLRALLAGPIGGIAAMGVGLAWAVWVPGDQQTRIVIGGLLVPLLWAGGMAWTLSDDKILRATAVLVGVALITFTASALRGFS